MLFSRNWLAQYVEFDAATDDLASRLTAAGFNVEGVSERGSDVQFDLEITTNRSDCMNHLGLARELAVIYGSELRAPEVDATGAEGPLESVEVTVDDVGDCPRYAARVVRGIAVGPSPDWLVERLEAIGQRPINNVVDVTNFVLWELGQPLHAFDLDTLIGPAIRVRRGIAGELMTTLDGEKRQLDEEILVIADAQRAVALAGVMGGAETEVSDRTVNVLIESAHFEPLLVRRGARRLGMQTDASHRFERGTDPEICLQAATRAAELIREVAGGEIVPGTADVRDESTDWRLHGSLERERLNAFAGVEIGAEEIERVLCGLGYQPTRLAGDAWQVRVPSWRYYDCEALRSTDPPTVWEADIYEELMRHFGYDNIPSDLPAIGAPDAGSSGAHKLRERLRDRLASAGLAEAINYAFYDALSDVSVPTLVPEDSAIRLANPLSENYGLMRRSLVPGLVENALFNQRRGADAVRLYELGHLFTTQGPEVEVVGIVCGGTVGLAWDRPHDLDLFSLKGIVESLAADAGERFTYRASELPGLVSGTGARIVERSTGDEVGFLGQLDRDDLTFPLFVAELQTEVLDPHGEVVKVRAPSRFPGIQADATLTHALSLGWEELAAAIRAAEVEDLIDWGLKDRYRGEGVPSGAVNTTIYFRYNSDERSLTQEEVNERHQRLVAKLESAFGWKGQEQSRP
jgi:phenylalanyl-tRNA synthetase beta chain